MAKVAFLGLGVMGYPMAGHLKSKGGHDVTVYNRNGAKADKWVAQFGGKKAATPKEAASGQDFVMMCVGNDNDVREVALGANGAFKWDAPEGRWTILRIGHTTTGKDNHPAPEAGRGLESDKLSRAATDANGSSSAISRPARSSSPASLTRSFRNVSR